MYVSAEEKVLRRETWSVFLGGLCTSRHEFQYLGSQSQSCSTTLIWSDEGSWELLEMRVGTLRECFGVNSKYLWPLKEDSKLRLRTPLELHLPLDALQASVWCTRLWYFLERVETTVWLYLFVVVGLFFFFFEGPCEDLWQSSLSSVSRHECGFGPSM